jgi:hypothetical protein
VGWFKVDDKFKNHPKVLKVGLEAIGLWLLAGCWASEYETDGFLPEHVVVYLPGYKPELVDRLVEAGLWKREMGGYSIHDFLIYNPSRAQQDAKRAAATERMAKGRRTSRELRANTQSTSPEQAETFAGSSGVPIPIPVLTGPAARVSTGSDPTPPDQPPNPPSVDGSTRARGGADSGAETCTASPQNRPAPGQAPLLALQDPPVPHLPLTGKPKSREQAAQVKKHHALALELLGEWNAARRRADAKGTGLHASYENLGPIAARLDEGEGAAERVRHVIAVCEADTKAGNELRWFNPTTALGANWTRNLSATPRAPGLRRLMNEESTENLRRQWDEGTPVDDLKEFFSGTDEA